LSCKLDIKAICPNALNATGISVDGTGVFVAAGIGVGGTFVFVAVGMGVNGAGVDVDRFNVGAGVESIAVGPVSVVPQPLSIHAARTNPILHIDNSLFISWLLSFQFIVLIR
jgi:hypothetical protein